MIDSGKFLRILQVSHGDLGGGAQNSAWYLFNAFRNRGHISWLAVGEKHTKDPDVFQIPNQQSRSAWAQACFKAGSLLNIRADGIRGVGRFNSVLGSTSLFFAEPKRWFDIQRGREDFHYPGTSKLLSMLPSSPDLIHCHNLHGGYFDLRVLRGFSKEVPVILNLRDAWMLSGHCAHSFECEKWKTGCGNCPDLTIPPSIRRDSTDYNWQRKKEIYDASQMYITTASNWMMSKVRQSMLKGVKYKVIPNGVDQRIFHPGEQKAARVALGLPLSPKIVLFSANFTRSNVWKDYLTMEKAVRRVSEKTPNMDLLFVCVGENSKEKMVGRVPIRFVEFQQSQEILAMYYQSADVYIHAAKAESFGRTITEALSSGIPVVATATGGIPEQILDGETGFLTPSGDFQSMQGRITELLTNESLRQQMGQKAAKDAQNRFALKLQTDRFLSWYGEVIDHWNASHPR